MQQTLEHGGHLFFGGVAVAGDGHFYFLGAVFKNGHVAAECGGNGHALCPAEFEHRLHVFAEERGFDGKFIGQVALGEGLCFFENAFEFERVIGNFFEPDHAHVDERHGAAGDANHAVAHDGGAGVDAEHDFIGKRFLGWCC